MVVAVGSALGVGGLLLAAVVLRPRPHSLREAAYLALPLAGAIVLALLAWGRV